MANPWEVGRLFHCVRFFFTVSVRLSEVSSRPPLCVPIELLSINSINLPDSVRFFLHSWYTGISGYLRQNYKTIFSSVASASFSTAMLLLAHFAVCNFLHTLHDFISFQCLQFFQAINKNVAKSYQLYQYLAFVRRNLKYCSEKLRRLSYISLIRSKLEYSSSVWDPHLRKDIHHLEMVQRRAARFIKRDYSYESSVTQMLKDLLDAGPHPWKTEEK